jgi:hypothetical protein
VIYIKKFDNIRKAKSLFQIFSFIDAILRKQEAKLSITQEKS